MKEKWVINNHFNWKKGADRHRQKNRTSQIGTGTIQRKKGLLQSSRIMVYIYMSVLRFSKWLLHNLPLSILGYPSFSRSLLIVTLTVKITWNFYRTSGWDSATTYRRNWIWWRWWWIWLQGWCWHRTQSYPSSSSKEHSSPSRWPFHLVIVRYIPSIVF